MNNHKENANEKHSEITPPRGTWLSSRRSNTGILEENMENSGEVYGEKSWKGLSSVCKLQLEKNERCWYIRSQQGNYMLYL